MAGEPDVRPPHEKAEEKRPDVIEIRVLDKIETIVAKSMTR
ncbi:hypothetical protein [Streptomyces sp. NPDC051569]